MSNLRRLRIAVPIILLIMILMRLVWMQLRSYPISVELRVAETLSFLEAVVDDCEIDGVTSRPVRVGLPEEDSLPRLISPGYAALGAIACASGVHAGMPTVRINQWLMAATVLLGTLLTRFVTSSWTLSLGVGAMLFSRGRLLADIGTASVDFQMMFLVTAWLACIGHFLRTGALLSLGGAALLVILATTADPAASALALVAPVLLATGYVHRRRLARPLMRRLRGARRQAEELTSVARVAATPDGGSSFGRVVGSLRWMLGLEFPPVEPPERGSELARGGLFRTLSVPFLIWIYDRRRWLRLMGAWMLVFALCMMLAAIGYYWLVGVEAMVQHTGWASIVPDARWLQASFDRSLSLAAQRLDGHLILSLAIIGLCALQSPASGLAGFLEMVWVALTALLFLACGAWLMDALDARLVEAGTSLLLPEPRSFILWVEPAMLSLGFGGLYNLMKVVDTRIAERA